MISVFFLSLSFFLSLDVCEKCRRNLYFINIVSECLPRAGFMEHYESIQSECLTHPKNQAVTMFISAPKIENIMRPLLRACLHSICEDEKLSQVLVSQGKWRGFEKDIKLSVCNLKGATLAKGSDWGNYQSASHGKRAQGTSVTRTSRTL